jgi:RimJ/RimL family protein N-acetyltransferase
MKTTTESITLSPGLDDAKLSTESLSTLIDMWSELQISTVEAVQAPTPNLFSFAETCFFFAVILKNEPLDSGNEGNFSNNQLEEEEFERALKRSVHDAAHARGGGSSSTVAAGKYTSQEVQRPKPLRKFEQNSDIYKREELPHDLMSLPYDMDDDTPMHGFHSPSLEPWRDSSVTYSAHEPSLYHDQARMSAHGAREEFPLSSLSRQFEPPTSTFLGDHNNRNLGQSPYVDFDNTTRQKKAIGIVYLACSPLENVPAGEASIGIILTPEARGKGLARQATELVLSWVFDDIGFHRVQAGILDSPNKDRAISMFTQL